VMSFYSWDIIATSLVIVAVYYAFKKNPRFAGLCLGLGFAAKAYPLLLLPVFLKDAQTWRGRFEMLLSTVVGGLIPNLPFMFIAFNGWFHTIAAPSGAGGGGIYVEYGIWPVIRYYHLIQDWSMAAVAWSLVVLAIVYATISNNSILLKLWLIEGATILVFPTTPPQFNVWLLPLFVLIPIFPYIPFLAFDSLGTAIILVCCSSFPLNSFLAEGISLARLGFLAVLLIWAIHKRSTIVQRDDISRSPVTRTNPQSRIPSEASL